MRPHRIRAPGCIFHVTSRGNNRQDIFQTDEDKLDYLGRIAKIFSAGRIRLLAYCLMTNHLHLLVQDTVGGALRDAIRRLHGAYAQAWNRRYGRSGHVFGERYHPEVVENEAHLVVGSFYIHNNSPEAGMVKRAQDYRWSSVHSYLGGSSDIPVSTDLILDLCGGPERYAELLEESAGAVSETPERLPDTAKVRDMWVAGSERFRERVESMVERRSDRRRRELRPEGLTLDAVLENVREQTGASRDAICNRSRGSRHISAARALFCMLARREGIPAVEISQTLGRSTSAVVHPAERLSRKSPGRG